MVIFNNVSIEEIPGLMVEDIQVSPIELSPLMRQRPIRFGADYVRITGGTRTVTVSFALLQMDRDYRSKLLMEVTKWARTDTPGKLQVTGYNDMYLMALCTQLPAPSSRQWWEDGLKVVFTAFEPYWISETVKSAQVNESFTVMGTAPPLMRIEKTISQVIQNVSWACGGDTMLFTDLPAGSLVIDLDRQTAVVGSTNVMDRFTLGSTFIRPRPGGQLILGTSGTIFWQERWE